MNKMKIFKLTLFIVAATIFSSCLKEEIIYHNQDDAPSSNQENKTAVKESSLQKIQKQNDTQSFTLTRNINLKIENALNEKLVDEKLALKFHLSWKQSDTIACESIQTDAYIITNASRAIKHSQTKHDILINTYQYEHGFGFDKINLDFTISDEQAFYQANEQQLPDFKFKTLVVKNDDKKFEYEFFQNEKKFHRYKYTFQFDAIFKSTFNDEQIIEPITRYAWVDIVQ